jgi:hypothetical protein
MARIQVVRSRLVSRESVLSDGQHRRSPRRTAVSLQCHASTVKTCLGLDGSASLGSAITARNSVVLIGRGATCSARQIPGGTAHTVQAAWPRAELSLISRVRHLPTPFRCVVGADERAATDARDARTLPLGKELVESYRTDGVSGAEIPNAVQHRFHGVSEFIRTK